MSGLNVIDSKTIDELQELGKINGLEKLIISTGESTKKVSIDTIIGYAAQLLNGGSTSRSVIYTNPSTGGGQSLVFIPNGEEIPISQRTPGTFYLEENSQTSIRTQINVPTAVKVSGNLGLRRV